MLDNASILVPLSWPAPHSSKNMDSSQNSTGVQSSQNSTGPVNNSPVLMILSSGQSSLSVFLSEWNTNARSSVAKNDIMQSIPDSPDADISSHGVQEVRTKRLSRAEPISTCLKSNKTVFSMSSCSFSVTCLSSHNCTKHVVPDPCP